MYTPPWSRYRTFPSLQKYSTCFFSTNSMSPSNHVVGRITTPQKCPCPNAQTCVYEQTCDYVMWQTVTISIKYNLGIFFRFINALNPLPLKFCLLEFILHIYLCICRMTFCLYQAIRISIVFNSKRWEPKKITHQ